MKKFLICNVIVFNIIFSLSGCSEGVSDSIHLQICGSYSVPGMFCPDLKGYESIVEVLEQDSKGRILYEYTSYNLVTEKRETALVLCQTADKEYVYFYEDQCYLLPDYCESDIGALKERNDWDAPLNEEKMSKRKIEATLDLYIITDSPLSYSQVKGVVCQTMNITQDEVKELSFVDMDSGGKTLYWLYFDKDGVQEKYLVLVNRLYEVSFLKIINSEIDTEALTAFKQENRWIYG